MKTWNVLKWLNKPAKTHKVSLVCPHCGTDAVLEVGEAPGGTLIAAVGLNLIFDPPSYVPPDNFMPDEIKCRTCRKIFSGEVSDVR